MINWFIENSVITGIVTSILMWLDWILTIAQEKERKLHYYEHYQSYPVNTIEGNHIVRKDVENLKLVNLKHILIAIGLGLFIAFFLKKISPVSGMMFIGFIWGIFLIVNTQHLSNLISYKISRKGIHGKILMHQRTGYLIQSARYFASFVFLLILSTLIENLFLYGVTLAAFMSSLRMFIRIRKVPEIDKDDLPSEIIE